MTTEELMKPRYKVIATWPGMELDLNYVGQVITLTVKDNKQWCIRLHRATLYDAHFDQYPHLFEPLPWWKDRKVEDMPPFVKSKRTGVVYSLKVDYDKNSLWLDGCELTLNLTHYLPATLDDYNAYLTTNQNNG